MPTLDICDEEGNLIERAPIFVAAAMRHPRDEELRRKFVGAHLLEAALGHRGRHEGKELLKADHELLGLVLDFPELASKSTRKSLLDDDAPFSAWAAGLIVGLWEISSIHHRSLDADLTCVVEAVRAYLSLPSATDNRPPASSGRSLWSYLETFRPVAHLWAAVALEMLDSGSDGSPRALSLDQIRELLTAGEQVRLGAESLGVLRPQETWTFPANFVHSNIIFGIPDIQGPILDCLIQECRKRGKTMSAPRELPIVGEGGALLPHAAHIIRVIMAFPKDAAERDERLESLGLLSLLESESLGSALEEALRDGTYRDLLFQVYETRDVRPELPRLELPEKGRVAGMLLTYAIGLSFELDGISTITRVATAYSRYLASMNERARDSVHWSQRYLMGCWNAFKAVAHLYAVEAGKDFWVLEEGKISIGEICAPGASPQDWLGVARMIHGWSDGMGIIKDSEAWLVPKVFKGGRARMMRFQGPLPAGLIDCYQSYRPQYIK